ncbi:hypothetical protein [Arthrobacter sp. H35-D1]|nr:hypothetical protein [Arthrobacter sp. H35-D1]MDJ0311796.1 hypothetical protein [Arthrobacter sp. H35-D1]
MNTMLAGGSRAAVNESAVIEATVAAWKPGALPAIRTKSVPA